MLKINEWSKTDISVQEKIKNILEDSNNKTLLSIEKIKLLKNKSDIEQLLKLHKFNLDALDHKRALEILSDTHAYVELGDNLSRSIIFFVINDEYDLIILDKSNSSSQIDIKNDHLIIISIRPFLILSMYGAIFGIKRDKKHINLVVLDEGDDGWGDNFPECY